MLLGFISLLLTVFQGMIQKTCISSAWTLHMLPCKRDEESAGEAGPSKEHFVTSQIIGRIGRRLLSDGAAGVEICKQKVTAPCHTPYSP
jgi:mlo protein